MRRRQLVPLALLGLLVAASLWVVWPANPASVLPPGVPWPAGRGVKIGSFERTEMRLGLDLQGGTRLLLAATIPDGFEGNLDDALDGTIRVLRRRVDASGVAEAEITRQGQSNISVQLPGLTPDEARSLLGRTALLRFCEAAGQQTLPGGEEPAVCDAEGQWVQSYGIIDGRALPLNGRSLKANAFVGADQLGSPAVNFEWQGDGPELSAQVTTRLLNQPLGIFLDNELLSAPNVGSTIRDRGQITGLDLQRAQELVIQLNSGALPLELSVLQQQQVDATLGADSVRQSVVAGEIAFLVVVLFMVLYYRMAGVLASGALLIYALLSLAMFKLIPITLTLAGIGAFVLSIGMAVDANILIFERMKEELRAGRGYAAAVDAGFARAWPSIRDSNASTLITCIILYALGGGIEIPGIGAFDAPLVRGFALTLVVGVGISMFTAITVTRALLHLFIGTRFANPIWLAPGAQQEMLPAGDR
ncbi:MAG: protein translocase subunit SecD [Dehalococcoidia bacterium]|nr:protein translocase subunit SecD [Dehalococcoidia bacterium]